MSSIRFSQLLLRVFAISLNFWSFSLHSKAIVMWLSPLWQSCSSSSFILPSSMQLTSFCKENSTSQLLLKKIVTSSSKFCTKFRKWMTKLYLFFLLSDSISVMPNFLRCSIRRDPICTGSTLSGVRNSGKLTYFKEVTGNSMSSWSMNLMVIFFDLKLFKIYRSQQYKACSRGLLSPISSLILILSCTCLSIILLISPVKIPQTLQESSLSKIETDLFQSNSSVMYSISLLSLATFLRIQLTVQIFTSFSQIGLYSSIHLLFTKSSMLYLSL